MRAYARTVRDRIERHGFHVTYVAAGDEPSFGYSTGIFATYAIPEVIISALPPGLTGELIAQYVDRFKGDAPPLGERIEVIDERFDYYLIPARADSIRDRVLASREFYGERPVAYVQLVYPDPSRKFPGEQGYSYDQEIFGVFPPNDTMVEPVGPDQSATAPESKTKGAEKPNTDSKAGPR